MATKKYTVDYTADYHQLAKDAAAQGNWDDFDYYLVLRDLKTADTGNDYGISTASIRRENEVKYNRYPQNKTESAVPNDYLGFYNGGSNETKAKKALEEYEGYSYEDYLKSDNYKSLEQQYTDAAQKSMQDTLGQAAARTGGMSSSYAVTAAQQGYEDFMKALVQAANDMYDSERNDLLSAYEVYDQLAQQDYKKYQDYRDFAYKVALYNDSKEATQASPEVSDTPKNEGDDTDENDKSTESVELTAEQAQEVYNKGVETMSREGIDISGLLSYEDWMQIQNDASSEWQYGYGVTAIGYDLAKNSTSYQDYVERFTMYLVGRDMTFDGGEGSALPADISTMMIQGASVKEVSAYCAKRNISGEEYDSIIAAASEVEEQISINKKSIDNFIQQGDIEAAVEYLIKLSNDKDICYETVEHLMLYIGLNTPHEQSEKE